MLTGQPRSGKTTLACLVGYQIEVGEVASPFWRVRYLDLTQMENADEVHNMIHMDRHWLLIIDNWHAAPECHHDLIGRLRNDWRDIGCLIVETHFPTSGEEVDAVSPLVALGQAEENAPINADSCLSEIAKGMVELHVQQQLGIEHTCKGPELVARAKSKNAYFDLEDCGTLTSIPTDYKRVRGNLRFLAWRLRAWNPTECHLSDVPLEQVIKMVDQTIVTPCHEYVGTLEAIAALAQWELPYLRGSGVNPPDGIRELERNNIIARMEHAVGWRLDSTDAYLVMLATRGSQWGARSLELTSQYLRSCPQQTHRMIVNLLGQADADVATDFVVGLLADPLLLEAEKQLLSQRAVSDRLSFSFVQSVSNCLLRDLPKDKEETDMRLNIASALLCKEIGNAVGRSARPRGLQQLMWLLMTLSKDESRFKEFVESFFEGYGEEALSASFLDTQLWDIRRSFLTRLKRFVPSLWSRLSSLHSSVAVSPQDIPHGVLPYYISAGSVQVGLPRSNRIKMLGAIDEECLLDKLVGKPRPIGRLRLLLQSALWLDKGHAWRLAAIVPRIWPRLGMPRIDIGKAAIQDEVAKLSSLVTNCWFANPEAAQDLVSIFLTMPLRALVPPEWASDMGRFLTAAENVRPGVIRGWSSTDADYLSDLFFWTDGEALDELLVPLAVFVPDVLALIIEKDPVKAGQKLHDASAPHNVWFRRGALSLCGELRQTQPLPNLPPTDEIAKCGAAQTILTLYALYHALGLEAVRSVLSSLAGSPETSPWIPLLAARTPMPWTPKKVSDMAAAILRGGSEAAAGAVYDVVLWGMMLQSIEWPRGYTFDTGYYGHRALRGAMHRHILRYELLDDQQLVRAVINDKHLVARSVLYIFQRILRPLTDSPLNLEEWDGVLRLVGTAGRKDYFRSKAIYAGIVEWSVVAETGRLEPRFSIASNVDRARLYRLMGLPLSESSGAKVAAVSLVATAAKDPVQVDLAALVRRVQKLEATRAPLSVEELRDSLSTDRDMQYCLGIAMCNEIVLTHYVVDPRHQTFPMSVLRLNHEHPFVQKVLGVASERGA